MNEAIRVIQGCIVFALAWAFWQYGWKPFALDQFRQALFSIRGDLFEMVMQGQPGFSFKSPEYIRLRQFFNGRIRFAHRVSFSQVVAGFLMCSIPRTGLRQALHDYKTPAQLVMDSIEDKDLKARLSLFESRASTATIQYLVMTSPFFFIVLLCALVVALICAVVKFQLNQLRQITVALVERELGPSVRAIDCQVEALDAELGPQLRPA